MVIVINDKENHNGHFSTDQNSQYRLSAAVFINVTYVKQFTGSQILIVNLFGRIPNLCLDF